MNKLSFRIGGEPYNLSQPEVEASVRHATPKPIDKHYVIIAGRKFPPKQVVSAATGRPVVSFTTMEANRVLKKLGFELGISSEGEPIIKTESETYFETYLNASGHTEFNFEKPIPGVAARPDYVVWSEGTDVLFELKEFHATPEDFRLGFGQHDPYGPIREKIDAGRKKFKDLKGKCCCLVLYNREKPLIHLTWEFVYGAMLGNLGFTFPFDPTAGKDDTTKLTRAFLGGGKMHRHDRDGRPVEAQNTTISAVLVLEHLAVGRRRFQAAMRRNERELNRKLNLEEHLTLIDRARGTEKDLSLTQLRIVVHENPYARIQLTRSLFCGPYDERYGESGGAITRVFAGEQISFLESLEEGNPRRDFQNHIGERAGEGSTGSKQ